MFRKTFVGWDFAPDTEWRAHIALHTRSYLQDRRDKKMIAGRGG